MEDVRKIAPEVMDVTHHVSKDVKLVYLQPIIIAPVVVVDIPNKVVHVLHDFEVSYMFT